jgi:hypothetical protein
MKSRRPGWAAAVDLGQGGVVSRHLLLGGVERLVDLGHARPLGVELATAAGAEPAVTAAFQLVELPTVAAVEGLDALAHRATGLEVVVEGDLAPGNRRRSLRPGRLAERPAHAAQDALQRPRAGGPAEAGRAEAVSVAAQERPDLGLTAETEQHDTTLAVLQPGDAGDIVVDDFRHFATSC